MDELCEEEYKKQQIERLNNITIATNSLKTAMSYIEDSCKPCDQCSLNQHTCDVNKSYKMIKKAMTDLDAFRYHLENSIRRGF